jgi:hypothetical protein
VVRASDISALPDFAVEHQREDLRDRRWARHRDMAWTAVVVIRVVLPALTITAFGIAHLLGWF